MADDKPILFPVAASPETIKEYESDKGLWLSIVKYKTVEQIKVAFEITKEQLRRLPQASKSGREGIILKNKLRLLSTKKLLVNPHIPDGALRTLFLARTAFQLIHFPGESQSKDAENCFLIETYKYWMHITKDKN